MRLALLLLLAAALPVFAGKETLTRDFALAWERQLAQTIVLTGNRGSFSSPFHSWNLMTVARFDAVNAIKPKYQHVIVNPDSVPSWIKKDKASPLAAAAVACHTILETIYATPGTAESVMTYHNNLLETQLATIPEGQAKQSGIELGLYVAEMVLLNRSTDGWPGIFVEAENCTNTGNCFGKYMWGFSYYYPRSAGQIPNRGYTDTVRPFTLDSCASTTAIVGPPLNASHPDFLPAWEELFLLGTSNATLNTLTPEKNDTAFFHQSVSNWGMISDTSIVLSHPEYEKLADAELARVIVLLSLSTGESHLCHLWLKWYYLHWRPSVAYRTLNVNPSGVPAVDKFYDPAWTPALRITPDAEYPSGHAARTTPFFYMMIKLFGDNHNFDLSATTRPLMPSRSYSKYSDYVKESGNSRIWAGSHWRFSVNEGQKLGEYFVQHVYNNVAVPLRGNN